MDMNERIMLIHPLVWREDEASDVRAVFLKNLIVAARIGAHYGEQGRTQPLRINLCVYLRPPFTWNDRLEDVLDYDRLRQGILDILAGGHIRLLETLGERIVEMCFALPEVDGVHLQLVKREAHDDCEVGYETRRRR